MTSITIALSDEQTLRLNQLAREAGVPPEELLRLNVEEMLSRKDDFTRAADHVLQKNAELYRRLA